jgi:hypothetical protein
LLNNDLIHPSASAKGISRIFQAPAKNAINTAKKPFLEATAAAPPSINAAKPYSATLSPSLN